MQSNKNKVVKIGMFVFTALIISIVTIYLIGSKNNLFTQKTYVTCVFKDIKGVVVGNNVRFSGINVGAVRNIEITSDSTVVLTLAIANQYSKFIRKNSIVEISQDGLMGGKLINIFGGSGNTDPIEDGDNLNAKQESEIENYLTKANKLLNTSSEILENIKSITYKIDSGNGDIAKLLNENVLTSELKTTVKQLNTILTNTNQITTKINSGKGDLAKLINDNELSTKTSEVLLNLSNTGKNANDAIKELNTTLKSINSGDGTISYLLNSKDLKNNLDSTIQNVNTSLEQFNQTAKAVEESWVVRLFSKQKKKDEKMNHSKDTLNILPH